ncbi:hypothetical protein [Luteimonas vadosa]|uniref:Lipoprotein n=1 Tax=Luteimonas vadosa TaxID=1165507 RepID=A0ABP9DYU8_9GAMM
MKHTKLALLVVVLCGGLLSACDRQTAPPAEAAPDPVAATPEPMDAGTDEGTPGTHAEDGDSPHTGGDRVGTGTGGIEEEDDTPHTGGDRVGTGGGNQEGH